MITVHHLENSRSQRIVWLLEELGVDYQIEHYQRDPATMLAPDSLKRLHPLGKSPLITDDETDNVAVAESGAIIETLLARFDPDGHLSPPLDSPERQDYVFWLHHAEASGMPPLVMRLIFSRLGKPPVPALVRPLGRRFANGVEKQYLGPEISRLRDFWEHSLAQHTWFAGDRFSAADIQMSFPVLALSGRGGLAGQPNLTAFLDRCRSREAYQRAIARGGELTLG